MSKYRMHLLVCGGTGCRASESSLIGESLRGNLRKRASAMRYRSS